MLPGVVFDNKRSAVGDTPPLPRSSARADMSKGAPAIPQRASHASAVSFSDLNRRDAEHERSRRHVLE